MLNKPQPPRTTPAPLPVPTTLTISAPDRPAYDTELPSFPTAAAYVAHARTFLPRNTQYKFRPTNPPPTPQPRTLSERLDKRPRTDAYHAANNTNQRKRDRYEEARTLLATNPHPDPTTQAELLLILAALNKRNTGQVR